MEEKEALQKIHSVLEHKGDLHSMTEFQLRNFVIGSQPTPASQYQQVCVELERRELTLRELNLKMRILIVDKAEIESNLYVSAPRRELQLELKDVEIEQLNLTLKELLYEIDVLVSIGEDLLKNLPSQINWEEHQSEYWKKKLGREAWIAWNTIGAIPSDVLRAAMSLPLNDRESFLKQIEEITSVQRVMLPESSKRDETPQTA